MKEIPKRRLLTLGLESHIRECMELSKSGYAFGYDYWFENGMKCKDEDTARDIARVLNESGEFGQATVSQPKFEDGWQITFGVWRKC
jgi:hypothetical protein